MNPQPLIVSALFVFTLLFFPTDVYSQIPGRGTGTCTEWIDGKWRQVPCRPDPSPRRLGGRDEPLPPEPENPHLSEAREQNDLGVKAQNNGNWILAAQYFERAVEKDPNSTLYRENLNNAKKQIEIAERIAREEAKRREQESLQAQRDQLEAARGKTELKPADGSNMFGLKPSNPSSSDLRPTGKRVTRNFSGPVVLPVRKQCQPFPLA